MKTTVSFYTFAEGLRETFSTDAITLLFDYFEEYEKSCGEELEYDPIAIRCDFAEMDTDEVRDSYQLEDATDVEEYLSYHTSYVGKTPDGFYVFQQF